MGGNKGCTSQTVRKSGLTRTLPEEAEAKTLLGTDSAQGDRESQPANPSQPAYCHKFMSRTKLTASLAGSWKRHPHTKGRRAGFAHGQTSRVTAE